MEKSTKVMHVQLGDITTARIRVDRIQALSAARDVALRSSASFSNSYSTRNTLSSCQINKKTDLLEQLATPLALTSPVLRHTQEASLHHPLLLALNCLNLKADWIKLKMW
ncbi:hypothetical protein M9H77_03280 [Catharanthus roseus]|uniref:Uncharacterized protein n=1 Tax=Catharanthus roseus TaxID=4058 RepID=A0ACC0CAZ0_CATRO|nr:hypothetical protein M9H77_03280 [Catharanthus roseus]